MGSDRPTTMTPGQKATFTRQLRQDRVRETAAAADAVRQVRNMQLALADVKAGRRVAGDQTIISQFNRIIEPDSVTMVSEYARSPQGVALVDRLMESINRIRAGGSGVPVEQLAEFVALAEQFAQNQVATANDVSTEIEAIAKEYGVDPKLVSREFVMPGTQRRDTIPRETAPPAQTNPAASGQPTAQPLGNAPVPGAVMRDGKLYINGVEIK
jgi:hypothetical protein